MQKVCLNDWCKRPFAVTDEDRAMLTIFAIDREPEHCPTCRHDHRRMFSPTLKLHRRTSDLSGEPILSIYHPRHAFPVYSVTEWWSDKWDGLAYGKPFDPARSFFAQFAELFARVPKMANHNENSENCEYSYSCGNAKNVYYSRTVHRSEDVYYSQYVTGYNRSICDCLICQRSEFLYECVQCFNCRSCTYLIKSSNCGDCHFSTDLIGCTDCLFCHNLRNKSFHVDNKPVSKEEYARIRASMLDGQHATLTKNRARFADVYAKTIWRNLNNIQSERCIGDNLTNCVNCTECYNCLNTQDARYCCRLSPSEKCVSAMDVTSGGIGELLYNCVGLGGGNYFMRMCLNCRLSSNLTYCADCYSTKNCFGCTGLKKKEYCILNTQYTKDEYERLVPQIIEHMQKTGEWGQFFPLSLSPFAWNEGNNSEEHPLSKEEVLRRGWLWHDEPEETKHFKIIPQELAFYRTMNLPKPLEHPDVRMARRRSILTPYMLFTRQCTKCRKEMHTSYPPERPEIVYCEECYLKQVY